MNRKYIIKNCEAGYLNFENEQVCSCGTKQKGYPLYCKDVSDCLLKQIVDECKRVDCDCFDQWCFANLILEKLEIEEVNE